MFFQPEPRILRRFRGPFSLFFEPREAQNRVFYVFLGLGGRGPLLAASGETLVICWPPFGGSWPSWAGLGVSWTVLGGPVECPRAVGNHPAPRELLHLKSKSRLSRLLLVSTSKYIEGRAPWPAWPPSGGRFFNYYYVAVSILCFVLGVFLFVYVIFCSF